ncbi:helix-turn-helix domain-containing protein [Tistrella bauzanensis]|uniref:helix-turn-helix domain-containing protein n=1 Tax=Tistrella TaxID=171436 RepID=UPI0031F63731
MMTSVEFAAARKALGFTQGQLAEALGMGRRSIADIEAGTSPVRVIHVLALERLSLSAAIEHRDPMRAAASIRREALDLAALIRGEAATT